MSDFISNTLASLWISAQLLLLSGLVFSLLSLVFKGPEAIAAGRRAFREIRLNLTFYVFDLLLIAPFVGLVVTGLRGTVDHLGLSLVHTNKTLSRLRSRGLAAWGEGRLQVADPAALAALGQVELEGTERRPLM